MLCQLRWIGLQPTEVYNSKKIQIPVGIFP